MNDQVLWTLGAPARALIVALIRVYQLTLSGLMGGQCRFTPSCSRYAEEAVRTRGAVVGSGLAAWRVLRCNPYGRAGHDPVPSRRSAYDAVTRPRRTTGMGA